MQHEAETEAQIWQNLQEMTPISRVLVYLRHNKLFTVIHTKWWKAVEEIMSQDIKSPPLPEARGLLEYIWNGSIIFLKSTYVSMIQQNNVRISEMTNNLLINSSKVNYSRNKKHPQKSSSYSFNVLEWLYRNYGLAMKAQCLTSVTFLFNEWKVKF